MAEPDYVLYPSREMQMDWLRVYLQAYKMFTKKTEEVSPIELETLYVQVNKFALVSKDSHTHTHFTVTVTHSLCLSLLVCRLHTSFGAFGLSSRPNTPKLTLTSWGESLCVC